MHLKSWTFAVASIGVACSSLLAADHTKDSLDKVKENVAQKKAVLLDVREQEEWDRGHLQAAQLLSLSKLRKAASDPEVKEKIARQLPEDRIVYCHCAKGVRALTAGSLLERLGFDARALAAGYDELREAGFPAAGK